jgi:hypothetical protein
MKQNKGIMADAAEAAPLVVDGSQPVWMTLNEARERAFTGEIVFETDPEVLAYLDNGIVYYAERVTDLSLGRRLLDAGVIDFEQLDRGMVRVGDIEHLGRLFDRDPSIDRDAVVVVAESATEDLIADLANRAVATVRVTAYRHHPSGVHRWFVAPLDSAAQRRPVSAVSQLDFTVVDDLPGLPFGGGDELAIEWDQMDGSDEILVADGFDGSLFYVSEAPVEQFEEIEELDAEDHDAEAAELSLGLAEFTDSDGIDDGLALDELVEVETVDELDTATLEDAEDFEFAVVWPDGSEVPATEGSIIDENPTMVAEDTDVEPVDELLDDQPVVTRSEDGNLEFTMPPLELSDEPELADAVVPDDVAEAVRRAIAAIESASVPGSSTGSTDSMMLEPEIADVEVVDVASHAPIVAEAPLSGFGGFAPPTMAMRAEVLYGLTDDDSAAAAADASMHGEHWSGAGVASVVFVDDPAEENSGGGNQRSSALRRLIGSLRRKDH